jgi:bacterioferritin
MLKPLIVDKPYPSLSNLSPNLFDAKIISPQYATSTGELNAILQYIYHSTIFSSKQMEETANTIKSIAIAEMLHFDLLAEALINLGVQPIYSCQPPAAFNFYSSKFVSYGSSLKNMIEDDILAEKHAINAYGRMLTRINNQTLYQLISRIQEDEKLHLETFQTILSDICGN